MKKFKALLFDINGTVSDIYTCDDDEKVFRTTANFLGYHGVEIGSNILREKYMTLNHEQRRKSGEEFPEFDVVKIFPDIIREFAAADMENEEIIAVNASLIYRAASLLHLEPYPGVKEILGALKKNYRLGAISDGQSVWGRAELRMAGLEDFFESMVISGDSGFRKPDPRIFFTALDNMGLRSDEVIYIGNDMFRDIYGASRIGIKTVFFKSNQGEHGFSGKEPDYIVYRFDEIPQAVEFLERHS